MALRKRKPTSPGRRFQTVSDFAEITKDRPEKSLLAPKHNTGGRNNYGRKTARHKGGGHKQRVPHDRLQAHQGRRARRRRRGGVRPEPQLPHPAAPLPRRREALHPRPEGRAGRRPPAVAARARRSAPATPCRCATSPSAPRSTPSSCTPVAAARWAARPAPPSSWWPRRATSPPCASPAPRCAASRSTAGPPSVRSATPRPSSSRWARPAATGGRASSPRPVAWP